MSDPNFLVIGAQKCGTTWLSEMLRQHPEVFISPRKEIHFFDLKANYARGMDWYRSHFEGQAGQKAVGECTPNYLWVSELRPALPSDLPIEFQVHGEVTPAIPARVHAALPDARLIAILRDPVNRAVSSYHHHVRMRRISPWTRILDAGGRFGILGMGFYFAHLSAWLEHFDASRLLVLIYEKDVLKHKEQTLRRVFEFLDVDPAFIPTGAEQRYNERSSNAYMVSNYYAARATKWLFGKFPALHRLPAPRLEVTDSERHALARIYQRDARALEELLGRRLPWKSTQLERSGPQ